MGSKKTWDKIRPIADEAIRAGLGLDEFLELADITRRDWYEIKPEGWHWTAIQKKLGIKREGMGRPKKNQTKPKPKPSPSHYAPKLNWYEERLSMVASQIGSEIPKKGLNQQMIELLRETTELAEFAMRKKGAVR